eukprot:352081_1
MQLILHNNYKIRQLLTIINTTNNNLLITLLNIFETIMNKKYERDNEIDDNKHENENEHNNDELIGYNIILTHSDCIQCITDCFENGNKILKSKVLRLLTSICITDDDGFEAVLNALYSYGDRHDASSIFDEFVRQMYFEHDLQFRHDALTFLNVILNICPDLRLRIESRHFLTQLGFHIVVDQLWEKIDNVQQKQLIDQNKEQLDILDENDQDKELKLEDNASGSIKSTGSVSISDRLYKLRSKSVSMKKRSIDMSKDLELDDTLLNDIREQLILYNEMQEKDNQKMLWNDINLNQPQDILEYLFNRAIKQNRVTDFMHTLISMCTIPDNSSMLWHALPQVILQITGRSEKYINELKLKMEDDNNDSKIHDTILIDENVHIIFDSIEELKSLLDKTLQETTIEEKNEQEKELDKLKQEYIKLKKDNIKLQKENLKNKLDDEIPPTPPPTAAPIPVIVAPIPAPAPAPLPIIAAPIPAPLPVTAAPLPAPLPGATAPIPAPAPFST